MEIVDEWGNWTQEANRTVCRLREKFYRIISEEVEGLSAKDAATITRFLATDAAYEAALHATMDVKMGKIPTENPKSLKARSSMDLEIFADSTPQRPQLTPCNYHKGFTEDCGCPQVYRT